ncbi:MAG: sulfotransferase domain-containing protein [Phycisphaerales bacterium JB052]
MSKTMMLQRFANQATQRIAMRYGASIPIYPVIEYPKSGGTWLSRMLAECLRTPFVQHSRLPVAMPCVVHGHWRYHAKLPNTTYLIRDGRDVVVSFYFHAIRPSKNPNNTHPNRSIERMKSLLGADADLSDIRKHLHKYIEFLFVNPQGCRQNWTDHNADWFERPGVQYIRYEDLRSDCVGAMTRLLQGLGREIEPERVERAVDNYSMERMTGRRPGQEDSSSFIRKGVVGDWKNHFTREAAETFDRLAGDMLIRLGYEQDREWVKNCD